MQIDHGWFPIWINILYERIKHISEFIILRIPGIPVAKDILGRVLLVDDSTGGDEAAEALGMREGVA